MSNYSFTIKEGLEEFQATVYQINFIIITNIDNTFDYYSEHPFVSVFDGATYVNSFLTRVSRDKKQLVGVFTSDAFSGLSTPVTISFGYAVEISSFSSVDINATIQGLSPFSASLGAPLGDAAWLASIS
jgi:hypothetical protein